MRRHGAPTRAVIAVGQSNDKEERESLHLTEEIGAQNSVSAGRRAISPGRTARRQHLAELRRRRGGQRDDAAGNGDFGETRDRRRGEIPQADDAVRADVEGGEHALKVLGREGDVDLAGEFAIRPGEPPSQDHNPFLDHPAQLGLGDHQAGVGIILKQSKILAVGDIDALGRDLLGSVEQVAVGVGDAQPRRVWQPRRLTIEQTLQRRFVDAPRSDLAPILVHHRLENEVDLREFAVEAGVERAAEVFRVGPCVTAFVGVEIDEKERDKRCDDKVQAEERKNEAPAQHGERTGAVAAAQRWPTKLALPNEASRQRRSSHEMRPAALMAARREIGPLARTANEDASRR